MNSAPAPIDLDRLDAWMDSQSLPAGRITHVEPLGGGTQNIVLLVVRGSERYVLRHPPVHKRANSDETMRREARVLGALAGSEVPHPRLIAGCPDTAVLGAAFYLMEPVTGANPASALPARYGEPGWRLELGLAMADAAAAIGAVDPIAVGLGDLGRADGFLERQVSRWSAQLAGYDKLAGYPGPELPGLEVLSSWLDRNRPSEYRPGLMHGDFHLANVMCRLDRPGVAAVVDWELATIGDPLLDLGWLLATWPNDRGGRGPVFADLEPGDWPDTAPLIARYAERSDRDLTAIGWYEVLACYKLGILLEGTHARACAGLAPRETGDRLHASAVALFERACRRIAGQP